MPEFEITPPETRTIGGVAVRNPIWLAPLAGVTTHTFRAWHRELGAGLVHTEMVSAVGMSYKNRKTGDLVGDDSEPGPIVLQLFAPDAESLMRGAELAVAMRRFDALEINMACPMPKVTKKGSGAKLLENPQEAARMVRALKMLKTLNAHGAPVWVKTRIADPNRHAMTTENFCALLFDAGADLLMLHGRTPAQRYEGVANKAIVCETAQKFPGRMVASGDVYTPDDAKYYLDGGCAAVLVARGSLRDVFVIPKILSALGYAVDPSTTDPDLPAQIDALIRIGDRGVLHEGERFTLVLVRRMLSGLFKGFHGAAAIRQLCAAAQTWGGLRESLLELREKWENSSNSPNPSKML